MNEQKLYRKKCDLIPFGSYICICVYRCMWLAVEESVFPSGYFFQEHACQLYGNYIHIYICN